LRDSWVSPTAVRGDNFVKRAAGCATLVGGVETKRGFQIGVSQDLLYQPVLAGIRSQNEFTGERPKLVMRHVDAGMALDGL